MSLKSMDPNALALLSTLLAIELTQGLDEVEQDILGNFVVALGGLILVISSVTAAAAPEPAEKNETKKEPAGHVTLKEHEELKQQHEIIRRQVQRLQEQVRELRGK